MGINIQFPLGSGNANLQLAHPQSTWNLLNLSKTLLSVGGHDPFGVVWEKELLFLLVKHQLRKGAKFHLPSGDAVLGRGQKDTFLYFLRVQSWGREEGRSVESWGFWWRSGIYPVCIAELPGIAYEFLPSEVCFGSDYNRFFPALPSVISLMWPSRLALIKQ